MCLLHCFTQPCVASILASASALNSKTRHPPCHLAIYLTLQRVEHSWQNGDNDDDNDDDTIRYIQVIQSYSQKQGVARCTRWYMIIGEDCVRSLRHRDVALEPLDPPPSLSPSPSPSPPQDLYPFNFSPHKANQAPIPANPTTTIPTIPTFLSLSPALFVPVLDAPFALVLVEYPLAVETDEALPLRAANPIAEGLYRKTE